MLAGMSVVEEEAGVTMNVLDGGRGGIICQAWPRERVVAQKAKWVGTQCEWRRRPIKLQIGGVTATRASHITYRLKAGCG